MEKLIEALLSDIGNPITITLLLIVGVIFLIKFVWNNWDRIKNGADSLYQRRCKDKRIYKECPLLCIRLLLPVDNYN